MSALLKEIQDRKSPLAFEPKSLSDEQLETLWNAARWSASSYNEQPWRFVYAKRENEEEFNRILNCLLPGNQEWAQNASVLMIACSSNHFNHNGKENRHAKYDLGQAVSSLSLQATNMGLVLRQMGGFSPQAAQEQLAIPENYEAVTAIALGYEGRIDDLPENLQARSKNERKRNEIKSFAFEGTWG